MDFVDAVSARDGARLAGFPFSFGWTSILADPVLYDIDEDGFEEIVIATVTGEILFLNRWGEIVPGRTLKVPKARIPKDWYVGLDDKSALTYMSLADVTRYEKIVLDKDAKDTKETDRKTYKGTTSKVNPNRTPSVVDARVPTNATRNQGSRSAWAGFEGWLTDEGLDSLQLFLASRPLTSAEEQDALFSPQYAHWMQAHPDHHQFPHSTDIFVDAHIYDSPVIADLDGDGTMELVVSVNYNFDDSITSKPGRVAKFPVNTIFTKYYACGVVAFSLGREQIKWISPLEVTTDQTNYMARIYAPPTVIDLDHDGKLEVVVGTVIGSVYVLKHDGLWNPKLGAINVDKIGTSVVAADVKGNGNVNLLIVDDGGNLVCFDKEGKEEWETRYSSTANHAPVLGDVDGDGILDVVLVTVAGHVWAFSGQNGKILPNFPIKLGSSVSGMPILLPLPPWNGKIPWVSSAHGLSIVVHANDGIVYSIHAKTGCVSKVDIGETSYGMILADDVTSNGFIDLIVVSFEGHMYCLSTGAPLTSTSATWKSKRDGRNSWTTGIWQGVRVNEVTKERHHVSGNRFSFSFEIIDERQTRGPDAHYTVSLYSGSQLWFRQIYTYKGIKSETIPAPADIMTTTLRLEVVNEHGQAFFDSWNVGFNQTWYRTLKWLVALPVVFMTLAILLAKDVTQFLP